MDDYIVFVISKIQSQLHHVLNVVIIGIHDVFPLDKYDDKDKIFLKKILKRRACGQLSRMC